MILGLDTETSGLWRDNLPANDPQQPDLVQLGAKLYDKAWNVRGSLTVLIKPNGWQIEAGAEKVHGISTLECNRYGIALAAALSTLQGMVACATRIVGHNVQFDRRVIAAAIQKAGGTGMWWERMGPKFFCTMENATDACQLPGAIGGFKFPKLAEAVAILAPDFDYSEQHDAEADIAATIRVYRALIDGGHAAPPKTFDVELD